MSGRPIEADYSADSLMAVRAYVERVRDPSNIFPTRIQVVHLAQSFDAACWLLRDARPYLADIADPVLLTRIDCLLAEPQPPAAAPGEGEG